LPRKWLKPSRWPNPKQTPQFPLKYQRHAKVFLEQEAKHFPPSRSWDHHIPLKADALDIINKKIYNLSKASKQAIKEWVYKMLKKGFIEWSDS
jgi:hypothetical protein